MVRVTELRVGPFVGPASIDSFGMPHFESSLSSLRAWLRGHRGGMQLLLVTSAALIPVAVSGQSHASASSVELHALSRAHGVLTLRALLDTVQVGHPLVAAARARVRAARGTRTTAGALSNPMLALEVEGAPLPGRTAPAMDRQTMAMATFPLQSFYQRWPQIRRADAQVRAAEADAEGTRQQVALDAARAYYRTALAQVSVDAAQNVAAWLDTVVAYNRARVKEGVAAEADLIRSEVERDRASADATMQEADLARARADLEAFLGDVDGPALDVNRAPLVVAVASAPFAMPKLQSNEAVTGPAGHPSGISGQFFSQVATTRPQVIAAQERFSAAGASVTSERTMVVRELGASENADGVLVCACGFVADHLEVLYDLDIEAAQVAAEQGLVFDRTACVNDDAAVMGALARRVVAADRTEDQTEEER